MQRAEESSARLAPEPTPPRSGLSPQVAFLALGLVIAILGAIVYLTKPEAPAPPTAPTTAQQPDFSLTNEEAITRFEELHRVELTAYRQSDPTLAAQVFTSNSPIAATVQEEIRQLVRDRVSANPMYSTVDLVVLANDADEIRLRQVAVVVSQFFDAKGRDITTESARQRQSIVWTLRLERSRWLIHDAVITASRRVDA
jgi:hypothetical protein